MEPWALYPAAVVTEMRRPHRSTRRIREKRDSQLCQMLQADQTDPVLTVIFLTRVVVVAGWEFHYLSPSLHRINNCIFYHLYHCIPSISHHFCNS